MKKSSNFFFIVLTLLLSCSENRNNSEKKLHMQNNIDYAQLSFSSVYQIEDFSLIDEWVSYIELKEFIMEFNSNDFSSVIENKNYLTKFFNKLKNTIPILIDKTEVKARLTVIETDFMKFESYISNYLVNEDIKIKMVKKINNSFSNLNFQIDKIVEKKEVIP